MHRFFADERGIVENTAYLNAEDAGHALRVLRLENGDEVELVCAPARYLAEIDSTEDGEVRLRVTEKLRDTEAQTRVTLYQGLPKADKMEWIVQKSTELGAAGDCARRDDSQRGEIGGQGCGEKDRALAEDRPRGGEAVRPRERAGGQNAAQTRRDEG